MGSWQPPPLPPPRDLHQTLESHYSSSETPHIYAHARPCCVRTSACLGVSAMRGRVQVVEFGLLSVLMSIPGSAPIDSE